MEAEEIKLKQQEEFDMDNEDWDESKDPKKKPPK